MLRRAAGAVGTARSFAARPAVRPWLIGATAALFLLLAWTSFRALPDEGRSPRPALVLLLVFVTTPATLVLNAYEYRFMARSLGHRITLRHALRVSLLASIANYLPAPGGVAVRTAALRQRGSTVRSAVSINAVAGLVWAGITGLIAGAAMLPDDRLAGRGALALAVGAVAVAASLVWIRRSGAGWHGRFGQIAAIELGLVLLSGLRVWISLAAIGEAAPLGSAIAISGATILAAALGIFPAGLGLREALAGGIAAAVGVPAAAAVAATAVERVSSQVGMAITAALTGVRLRDLRGRTTPADDDASPEPEAVVASPTPSHGPTSGPGGSGGA